eukprot:8040252-Lingulodinium_polyedra.AAC.1
MGYATALAFCLHMLGVPIWHASERLVQGTPPRLVLAVENWHWQLDLVSPWHADTLVHMVRLATDGE